MNPRNVALYLRVSTDDQTTVNQMPDLTSYAERHGWKIVESYLEEGITGSIESRPALDRLREDAKHGRFTAVLCWKFDRISRNTRHLLTLYEELAKSNVSLVSITQVIDTATSAGKLMMTILAAFAEHELADLKERTRAGIRRAKAQGKQIGRTPQVAVDDSKILELLAAGKNAYQIMKELGVPRTTVYRKVAALKAAAIPPAYVATDEDIPF